MTIEEQIKEAAEEYVSGSINDEWEEELMYNSFIAGAEWQAKQSAWHLIGDRSNPMPNDKPCLLMFEDGSVADDSSDREDKCLIVVAWKLRPSLNEILEANKDVLQRMKKI